MTHASPILRVRKPLNANYTRRVGDRIRLECEFELVEYYDSDPEFSYGDFTLYWVKNYQELLHPKRGYVHIIRKNLTTM